MSRIGRKPVSIPDKVKVTVKDHVVTVTGPQGTLTVPFNSEVQVSVDEAAKAVTVAIDEVKHKDNRQVRALWGTTRALINSACIGASKGYEKSLEVVGVGWNASVAGTKLKLVVGYANPVMMDIPKDVKVVLDEKNKQIVRVSGPNKQAVGMFASAMRSKRKPEPYNGKGIKYTTETIKRKSGKAFGTA
jgi:large subunit ribosomal protein L6